jgi:hypothetical protein
LALGEKSNRTVVFGESDEWNAPLRTFTYPIGTMSADGSRRAWETSTGNGTQLFAGAFAGPGEPKHVTKQGGFEVFAFARGGSRFLYWMTEEEGADVWSYGLDVYMAGGAQPVKTGVSTLVGDEVNMLSLSPGSRHAGRRGRGRQTDLAGPQHRAGEHFRRFESAGPSHHGAG